MKTVINSITKKLLFAVAEDNYQAQENETIISELCTIENPEAKEIYFNEETRQFYEKV